MSAESNKQLFQRFLDEVVSRKNLEAIDEFVARDFIEHEELPPGVPPGLEGIKFFFAEWAKGFPDGRASLDMSIAEGDLVVGYETWRGTHTGEYLGMPPSGKTVAYKVIDIVRVANGKVVEHWGVGDNLALMQQIGAIPEAAGL